MDANEQARETYAHFGLAMYSAQVLEHGLASAMMIASKAGGGLPSLAEFEAFLDGKFERTLGGLIRDLRSYVQVDESLERLLDSALKKRNWLAHRYFRERAAVFMTEAGCKSMIAELEAAQDLFGQADGALDEVVKPLATRIGLTDERIEAEVNRIIRELRGG